MYDSVRERTRGVTDGRYLYIRNFMTDVPHLIPNAYRERIPMTHDLYALRDGGERAAIRTAAQWQIASTQRPEEELYDRVNDPWQVRNLLALSDEPRDGPVGIDESTERIRARAIAQLLSAKLGVWMADCDDMGAILPETRLLSERLWPPSGEQPTSTKPSLNQEANTLDPIPSASIGYRILGQETWWPYRGQELQTLGAEGETLEFFAHRIGHLPSEIIRFEVTSE